MNPSSPKPQAKSRCMENVSGFPPITGSVLCILCKDLGFQVNNVYMVVSFGGNQNPGENKGAVADFSFPFMDLFKSR